MIATIPVTPARAMSLIGRGVFIELLRRKDAYVLLVLVGLHALAVLTVSIVGVQNPATGTFLLNLGLTLTHFASHLLVMLLAVRQIPAEIDGRTLYPLLAKPIERRTLVLGKWSACTACGAGALLLMVVLVWVPAPKLEAYSLGLLAQALALQIVSLGLVAAVSLLLSLLVPRGVALVAVCLTVFLGDKVAALTAAQAADSPFERPLRWLLAYVPDFSKLDLFTRLTDGIAPLSVAAFTGLAAWGALCTAAALALGAHLFERRAL